MTIITLISCSPLSKPISQGVVNDSCISPIIDFSYSLNKNNNVYTPESVLPKQPWIQQSLIPIDTEVNNKEIKRRLLGFVKEYHDFIEIWIYNLWEDDENNFMYGFEIYNTKNQTWRHLELILKDPIKEIIQIYISDTGDIWARVSLEAGVSHGYISGYTKIPFGFARITENGELEYLDFSQNIPLGPVSFDGNKFWVFEEKGPIYSLDPKKLDIKKYADYRDQEIHKILNLPENIVYSDNELEFNDDGDFYFINSTPKEYHIPNDMYLFRFVPNADTFEAIPILLKNNPPLGKLFIDRAGNLWLSDYGWMDVQGNWHQIVRSPVFITTKVEGQSILWENPQIISESSDGRLWFISSNGMTWLDPKKGEWCWFTTYQSNIVEDSDRNLWMIADNKLYKLPLGEQ